MLYKADIFYILIRKRGKFKVTDVPSTMPVTYKEWKWSSTDF